MGSPALTQATAVPVTQEARIASMQNAYAAGDHQAARKLAAQLLSEDDAEARTAATRVLRETEPDRFIEAVALVGLGVVAWLVYNYVL